MRGTPYSETTREVEMLQVTLLLIHTDKIKDTPKDFQDYAKRYFAKSEIFGQSCMFAIQTPHGDQGSRGVVPYVSHLKTLYLSLKRQRELTKWMDKAIAEGLIWKFHTALNDGGSSCFTD